jgi:hypothetical protein
MRRMTCLALLFAVLGSALYPGSAWADDDDCDEEPAAFIVTPFEPGVTAPRKRNERVDRFFGYGVTALAGAGLMLGLGKMYFAWRGWQQDAQRQRAPWERAP